MHGHRSWSPIISKLNKALSSFVDVYHPTKVNITMCAVQWRVCNDEYR